MDGVNGGWALLYGPDAVAAQNLNLAVDEDQLGNGERSHLRHVVPKPGQTYESEVAVKVRE